MDPGKKGAEKVLADAISMDGRKELICKFCSELNVSTRRRCRRCYTNIRAGLRESTSRQWQQGPQKGQRAPRRRAERRIESLKVRRQRIRSFGPKLSIIGSRVEEKRREGKAFHPVCRKRSDLQQQLQEVEQRRHDLMPERQRAQKRSQKIQSIQDKGRNVQRKSTAAKEEMRTIREEIDRKEERFRLRSDKVHKNRMADAEMEAELQGLQAGEE